MPCSGSGSHEVQIVQSRSLIRILEFGLSCYLTFGLTSCFYFMLWHISVELIWLQIKCLITKKVWDIVESPNILLLVWRKLNPHWLLLDRLLFLAREHLYGFKGLWHHLPEFMCPLLPKKLVMPQECISHCRKVARLTQPNDLWF